MDDRVGVATAAGTPFCPECGSILSLPDHNPIECNVCGFTTNYEEISLPVSITFVLDVLQSHCANPHLDVVRCKSYGARGVTPRGPC